MDPEDDIYIRILKFGENHPKGFNRDQVIKVAKNKHEESIIDRYLDCAYQNHTIWLELRLEKKQKPDFEQETLFLLAKKSIGDYKKQERYFINLDSRFKYIDYSELKEARKTAKQANRNAIFAIIIALVALVATILVGSLG